MHLRITLPPSSVECPAPKNLHVAAQIANMVTYDWDDCGCSSPVYYTWFVKDGETSPLYSTTNSEFTFNNVSGGTYHFYFYTACLGEVQSIIIDDILIG